MTLTMRDAFATTVTGLLDQRDDVALILADIGVSRFAATGATARHRDRVINVGIREQLMIGVAAGFALEGFRPIAHSYTPFLVERPFEQIKLGFSHQGLRGVLVSVGASYDATTEGRTHQAPEDVALISTLPDWAIAVPGHPDEATAAILSAVANPDRSTYIRLADRSNPVAHVAAGDEFLPARDGSPDAPLIIAVGPMLDPVLAAIDGTDATVLYASTVRPFDHHAVAERAGSGNVILIEPYLAGTSAAEVSSALRHRPHRLLCLGVPNAEHRHYGRVHQHDSAHGLDAEGLRRDIDRFLAAA